jgi:hypothetical protein
MHFIKYQNLFPLKAIRERNIASERDVAGQANLSRTTLRNVEAGDTTVTLENYIRLSRHFDRTAYLLSVPKEPADYSQTSTLGVSMLVQRDGFNSWKTHFFNLVDAFRKDMDPLLILLPPPSSLDEKLKALLGSIVQELCREAQMDSPSWAQKRIFLEKPWFVSEMESLKAFAIQESSIAFRSNNIFVHDNFLKRA